MPFHRFALAAALCAAAGASPLAAQSRQGQPEANQHAPGEADVTIRVPLNLANMASIITQAVVQCSAFFTGDATRIHANNQAVVDIAGGAYSGPVDVKLQLSVAAPGEQWKYACKLMLYNASTKSWSQEGDQVWAHAKAGTTPVTDNSGMITVQ